MWFCMCHAILGMVIPPLNRNPYNGYINPYYWVDFSHPLLYGNKGSWSTRSHTSTSLLPQRVVTFFISHRYWRVVRLAQPLWGACLPWKVCRPSENYQRELPLKIDGWFQWSDFLFGKTPIHNWSISNFKRCIHHFLTFGAFGLFSRAFAVSFTPRWDFSSEWAALKIRKETQKGKDRRNLFHHFSGAVLVLG